MHRLKTSFEKPGSRVIPFLMAGDPDPGTTLELMRLLAEEGVTAIELGVPFSDPVADGPVIQAASGRALDRGVRLPDVFRLGRSFRESDPDTPLILFSYANPIYCHGVERAAEESAACGFDGWIIPDVPVEESGPWKKAAESRGLALIPLVAPTSSERIRRIVAEASGFVYCVSSLGTTGVRSRFDDRLERTVAAVKDTVPLPVAVGFGVSGREQSRRIREFADAVVIGSALVKRIHDARFLLSEGSKRREAMEAIRAFVREVKSE
ncbi:tryptophan synthase subunit alpha [Staphylospora marina]|uniref:tryptophan synthase subunit alpha n=1 Tax=Staphylospora marina TaxID=2490858 RepID=UPI000F5B9C11|nr:tryptophan synthase subunit alpha [Staphylospora marina]